MSAYEFCAKNVCKRGDSLAMAGCFVVKCVCGVTSQKPHIRKHAEGATNTPARSNHQEE